MSFLALGERLMKFVEKVDHLEGELETLRRAKRIGFTRALDAASRVECGKFDKHLPIFKSLDEALRSSLKNCCWLPRPVVESLTASSKYEWKPS